MFNETMILLKYNEIIAVLKFDRNVEYIGSDCLNNFLISWVSKIWVLVRIFLEERLRFI